MGAALLSAHILCFCALTIVCMWHLRSAEKPRPPSITLSSSTQRAALLYHHHPPTHHPHPPHPTVSLGEALKWERLKIDLDLTHGRVEKEKKKNT